MYIYNYDIKKNTAVNRWWLSEIKAIPYNSEVSGFDGEINYTEGYVDRMYPVRRSFLKEDRIGSVELDQVKAWDIERLYLPFGNNRVEGTDFFHNPMHLSFVGETYLFVEEACTLSFDLYTCGGVKLWLENELVEHFTPYTRNCSSKKSLQLKLMKGLNRMTVYTDDLGERDVLFYFELRYMDKLPLIGALQMEEPVNKIKAFESFLSECHFDRDIYSSDDMMLTCKQGILLEDESATLFGPKNGVIESQAKELSIGPRTKEIFIAKVHEWPVGFHRIKLQFQLGKLLVAREFLIGTYPEHLTKVPKGHNIAYRKKIALDRIALDEVEYQNKILALLVKASRMTPDIELMLEDLIAEVENREDNSVTIIGLFLLIYERFPKILGAQYLSRIESSIIGFRYWCDEPGNDVMWFFSETHALHFHIAQFLSGSAFMDAQFSASRRQGEEQAEIGKIRLLKWFEHFFENGYGDWNAITHMPVNIMGFLYLYELTSDDKIRESAMQCLDFTFRQITYHSFKGSMSATFGRAYEDELKGRELTEAAYLAWITNGEGYVNNSSRAAVVYAFSSYEPDDTAFEVDVEQGEGVIIELNQGIKTRAIYSYKTYDYMMSAVQNFPPFISGHQQHIMNIALGHGVQCYINHPGERNVSGYGRPSYWAGNGSTPMIRQYRNIILMRYQIPEASLVHYIHLYLPMKSFDEIRLNDQELFVRTGNAYLGIRFSHPISWQEHGPTAYKEILCHGRDHNIYIKCNCAEQWEDFESFIRAVQSTVMAYDFDKTLKVNDPEYGIVEMDVNGQLGVADVPIPLYTNNEVLIERTRLNNMK